MVCGWWSRGWKPPNAAAPVLAAAPVFCSPREAADGMWMVKAKHARFLWCVDGVDVVDVVGVSDGEAARFAKACEKKILRAEEISKSCNYFL